MPDADAQLLAAITKTDDLRGARLLNLPAGDGALSAALRDHGIDAVSADLFPEACYDDPDCVKADMNGRLPFDDDSFDALVCQEGVEHLENLAGYLRECRRVLRDGAHVWITTPNFMDISSRLAWLFSGQKSWRAGVPNEQSTLWGWYGERCYHGHAFHLPWFQLRYLLRIHAFDEFTLTARSWSTTSRLFYPVLRPLIGMFLARGLRSRQKRERRRGRSHPSDVLRKVLHREGVSRALLCGKGICVHARLREASCPPRARPYIS